MTDSSNCSGGGQQGSSAAGEQGLCENNSRAESLCQSLETTCQARGVQVTQGECGGDNDSGGQGSSCGAGEFGYGGGAAGQCGSGGSSGGNSGGCGGEGQGGSGGSCGGNSGGGGEMVGACCDVGSGFGPNDIPSGDCSSGMMCGSEDAGSGITHWNTKGLKSAADQMVSVAKANSLTEVLGNGNFNSITVGSGGHDTLVVGNGNDDAITVVGSATYDTLSAGTGYYDVLTVGYGNYNLLETSDLGSNSSGDILTLGSTATMSNGNVLLTDDANGDTLTVIAGNDNYLEAGTGIGDMLSVGTGNSNCLFTNDQAGNAGDVLSVGSGNGNMLSAGDGNDNMLSVLSGDNNVLIAGDGTGDYLNLGSGNGNFLVAGDGNFDTIDAAYFSGTANGSTLVLGDGEYDLIQVGPGNNNSLYTGDGIYDTLSDAAGSGEAGNDNLLCAGNGNGDTLYIGAGMCNYLDGGSGTGDTIYAALQGGGATNDTLLLNDVAGAAGVFQADSIIVGSQLSSTPNNNNLVILGDGNYDTGIIYSGSGNEMFAGNGAYDALAILSITSSNNNLLVIGNGAADTIDGPNGTGNVMVAGTGTVNASPLNPITSVIYATGNTASTNGVGDGGGDTYILNGGTQLIGASQNLTATSPTDPTHANAATVENLTNTGSIDFTNILYADLNNLLVGAFNATTDKTALTVSDTAGDSATILLLGNYISAFGAFHTSADSMGGTVVSYTNSHLGEAYVNPYTPPPHAA